VQTRLLACWSRHATRALRSLRRNKLTEAPADLPLLASLKELGTRPGKLSAG
jgi:hypothetical protein